MNRPAETEPPVSPREYFERARAEELRRVEAALAQPTEALDASHAWIAFETPDRALHALVLRVDRDGGVRLVHPALVEGERHLETYAAGVLHVLPAASIALVEEAAGEQLEYRSGFHVTRVHSPARLLLASEPG